MTSRERVLKALRHEQPDRVPIHDGMWSATVRRWQQEGLPEDVSPAEYFGHEIVELWADLSPRYPVVVLSRDDKYVTATTAEGGVQRNFRDHTSTPEIIEWPVKSREDWEKKIKPRLKADITRVDWASSLQAYARARNEGKFIVYDAVTGYSVLQMYMHTEQLLMAIAQDPEWVREVVMCVAQLALEMAEIMMTHGFEFDAGWLWNDLGYSNGLIFSPQAYRHTHYEADKMLCDFFHSKGLPVLFHTDGNMWELIPALIEVGFDCLQPLEVKANMDLVELKRRYGNRIALMGGIDVRAMADADPRRIEEEVRSKLEVAKEGGGYIYHSDHSVPPNVSFQQYRRTLELVREYGRY